MSGGHYRASGCEYSYYQVRDFAEQLRCEVNSQPVDQRAARLAFAKLLFRVCEAMREIDWVDAGDFSWGEQDMPEFHQLLTPATRLESATKHAEEVLELLIHEIDRAKGAKP